MKSLVLAALAFCSLVSSLSFAAGPQPLSCNDPWLHYFRYACGLGVISSNPKNPAQLECLCGKPLQPIDIRKETCDLLSPAEFREYRLVRNNRTLSKRDEYELQAARWLQSPVVFLYLPIEKEPPFTFTFEECGKLGGGWASPRNDKDFSCLNEKGQRTSLPGVGACMCTNKMGPPRRRLSSLEDEACPNARRWGR